MPKNGSYPIPAILLGGREVRHLRVPKQILPFGDATVLGKTLRAYLDAGVSEVILVLGYKADLIASELGTLPPNVRIAKNPLFDEGMGTFLRIGVREIPAGSQGFCIGLGDQPLLTADLVGELMKAFVEGNKKVLVPVHQSSLGLPVFFQASVAEEILALPPRGELWDIIKRHGDDLIDYPTGYTSILRSIEDQDDYHAMLRIAGLPIPDPIAVPGLEEIPASPPDEPSAV
jgi:molybdenum cofactor cytidylyltransferase